MIYGRKYSFLHAVEYDRKAALKCPVKVASCDAGAIVLLLLCLLVLN